MDSERIFLADDAATAALGARLAASLAPGDLVLLSGGLGAGKTALARAMIRSLMDDPVLEVPSPSFALVQPYESAGRSILHADLYRIGGPREIDELGVLEAGDAVVFVEWPERAPELFGRRHIDVRLSIPADGTGRIAEIAR